MALRVAHPYLHTRVSLFARGIVEPGAAAAVAGKAPEEMRPLFESARAAALLAEPPARRTLEQRRLALLLDDVLVLSRPLTGHAREFLLYWMHLLELANLKAIVRGRMKGQDPAAIREELLDMGPFAVLPVEALLRAEDEVEVLRLLERTPFAAIASRARQVLEQSRDMFFLDTTFDRRFYQGLAERAARIRPRDPPAFHALMGWLIDGTNLLWLLRYRFDYGLAAPETYYLLIPSSYRLAGERLRTLAAAPSFEAVLAALPKPYARAFAGCEHTDAVAGRCEHELRRAALDAIRRSSSAFTRAFAYLIVRIQDLQLLRGMIRARVLGIDAGTTLAALRLEPRTAVAPIASAGAPHATEGALNA